MYCAASSACYSSVGPGTASRGVVSRAIFAGRIRSPRRTVTDALLPIVPAVICRSGLPKAPTRSSSCLKAAKEKDGESSTTGKGGDDTLKVEASSRCTRLGQVRFRFVLHSSDYGWSLPCILTVALDLPPLLLPRVSCKDNPG